MKREMGRRSIAAVAAVHVVFVVLYMLDSVPLGAVSGGSRFRNARHSVARVRACVFKCRLRLPLRTFERDMTHRAGFFFSAFLCFVM